MHCWLMATALTPLAQSGIPESLVNALLLVPVLLGLTVIIFFHELGHFLAAKWTGVRVDRFAVGFGPRLFGWRHKEGLTFGNRPPYNNEQLAAKGYGETDYCLNLLPLGGYVKMVGEDDFIEDEKTGDLRISDDPRAYPNRPVGHRMIVVSAGVVFNILLAAVLLMFVFLLGRNVPAPVVGSVETDSRAQGKLMPGDRIVSVDGKPVRSFMDLRMAAAFSSGELRVTLQRDGQTQQVTVEAPYNPREHVRTIDVLPQFTTKRTEDGVPVVGAESDNLLKGDVIEAIDGKAVKAASDVMRIFQLSEGRVLALDVTRPAPPKSSEPPKKLKVRQQAQINLLPATLDSQRKRSAFGDSNILGLIPRLSVAFVEPNSPAQRAGLRRGDLVVEWAGVPNPNYDEIIDGITSSPGKPLDAKVLRGDKIESISVTPSAPFALFGDPERPKVGVRFDPCQENDAPIVADTMEGTPFAELRMPRGSRILSIDGKSTANWIDIVNALFPAAGRTVEVRFRSGDEEAARSLHIPGSLVNELNMPPGSVIHTIDGKRDVETTDAEGKKHNYMFLSNAAAVREYLKTRVGETVTIRWAPSIFDSPREASFAVRSDNMDPWQMRVSYSYDLLGFELLTEPLSAGGNPVLAMQMGGEFLWDYLRQSYMSMVRIATRDMGVQNVSGPIGIAAAGMEFARLGLADLLLFMSILSIGLAVMNFLPLPVMDGGQMVFLIIEKIKGKPMSFKTQIITTMVGLAAILIIFVFVTVQDIGRLISS